MGYSTDPDFSVFKNGFTGLTDAQIDAGERFILGSWAGVFDGGIWADDPLQSQKQSEVKALLVCWWLANVFPSQVAAGNFAGGALVLSSRSISGLSTANKDIQTRGSKLGQLLSNQWGAMAFEMLTGVPELNQVFVGR